MVYRSLLPGHWLGLLLLYCFYLSGASGFVLERTGYILYVSDTCVLMLYALSYIICTFLYYVRLPLTDRSYVGLPVVGLVCLNSWHLSLFICHINVFGIYRATSWDSGVSCCCIYVADLT